MTLQFQWRILLEMLTLEETDLTTEARFLLRDLFMELNLSAL